MKRLIQLILSIGLAWIIVKPPQYNIKSILNNFNKQQKTSIKKKALFAFSSDEDIAVEAVELLKALQCQTVASTGICDQILDHFKQGLGSELHIIEGFENIVEIAKKISTKQDLGGNAVTMALRAFKEGADVYLHTVLSRNYYQNLFNSSITIVPQEFLRDEISDVHLVINFKEGDQFQNIICPRTNRLYLQNDKDNTQFPGLDQLGKEIAHIKPDLLVLGGFQLMNQKIPSEYQDIVLKLEHLLANTQMKVHFELGAFTDPQLLQFLTKHLLPKVHSTGMNEQELYMFYQFLKEGTIQEYTDLSTNEQIKMVIDLLEIMDFQRIHFHSQNIQMICSDKSWGPVKQALHRSVLVGVIQAMKTENDNQIDYEYLDPNELDIHLLNENLILYPSQQIISQTELIEDVGYCWEVRDKECCISPVLIHPKPKRTCGLGDNIGAASLLQQLK